MINFIDLYILGLYKMKIKKKVWKKNVGIFCEIHKSWAHLLKFTTSGWKWGLFWIFLKNQFLVSRIKTCQVPLLELQLYYLCWLLVLFLYEKTSTHFHVEEGPRSCHLVFCPTLIAHGIVPWFVDFKIECWC